MFSKTLIVSPSMNRTQNLLLERFWSEFNSVYSPIDNCEVAKIFDSLHLNEMQLIIGGTDFRIKNE